MEPPPYKAQLDHAEASLASDPAKAAFATIQKERFSSLVKTQDTSAVRAEQTPPDGKEADAAVLQEQAAVEVAAILYSYTQVSAPFDGI